MITEVTVVVPASNEETDIARCPTARRAVRQPSLDTVTGSRLHGRIEHGFAGCLGALGEHETELAGVIA